jgi:hypothetical protein
MARKRYSDEDCLPVREALVLWRFFGAGRHH